jgi:hypothetical protein
MDYVFREALGQSAPLALLLQGSVMKMDLMNG